MRHQTLNISRRALASVITILIMLFTAACGSYHSDETKDAKFQTMQQGMAPQVPNKYDGRTAVYSLQIADQAAERVVMLEEVDQAYVLLYDGNAFVAVRLQNQRNMIPPRIHREIVEQVLEVVPEAGDVYVTTNLTFVDLIYSYVHGANLGRNDAEMEEQIRRLLDRSFTAQHGRPR